MAAVPTPPPLGQNIMALRKKKGMSLDELARRSGVSKAMLSQVEQHKTNPTIATLWKIAHGLDVGWEQVLGGQGGQEDAIEVVRRADAPHLPSASGDVEIQVCSWLDMVEDLELYHLRFESGGVLDSEPHFSGTEEFAVVLKGQFQVTSGSNEVSVKAGDSVRYPADRKHTIRNTSRGKGELFLTVHFKKEG